MSPRYESAVGVIVFANGALLDERRIGYFEAGGEYAEPIGLRGM